MVIHNYTLEKIAGALNLAGWRLEECFSQEKGSLVMLFSDGFSSKYLQIYTDSVFCSAFLRDNFARGRKNTADVFPELIGETLQDIKISEADRILSFSFIHTKLYIMLFGGAMSSLVAADSEDRIIDVFNAERERIGKIFTPPPGNLRSLRDFPGDATISEALKKSSCLLGKYYSEEFLERKAIAPNKLLGDFSAEELSELEKLAELFISEIKSSKEFYILETEKKKALLSLIPLRAYPNVIKKYDDINLAVQERIIHSLKYESFYSLYKQMHSQFSRLEKKLRTNIELMKDETGHEERAAQYTKLGELLMSQPNPKSKPGNKIKLNDWEGAEIEITLDPKLTILDNGAKYFDKARKTREAIAQRKRLLPDIERKLGEASEKLRLIESAKTLKELERIKQSSTKIHGVKMNEGNRDRAEKFRQFDLGEGFILYVGKSAADNDELTVKFASPNDLWFHARGAQGSHCVLKNDKNQNPTKEIIKKAAAIAAYYSKARNAKYTPVAYALKKYVRKPKGANTGTVTMSREEVIMVQPGLPE